MRPYGFALWILIALVAASTGSAQQTPAPSAELDTFMQQVLARRDDNWKKVQQYILDEQERIEFRGPAEALLWGQKREYTWYPRDGFFVRSPVRFNGVTIKESEREKYEENFLRRVKNRDERASATKPRDRRDGRGAVRSPEPHSADPRAAVHLLCALPRSSSSRADGTRWSGARRSRRCRSSKIEYYPTKLFSDEPSTRAEARTNQVTGRKSKDDQYGQAVQQMMNKVSLVTLWVEPTHKQIVKYTFDNIGLDFLPAAWLVRVTDLRANMLMSEVFAGVWLPRRIDMAGAFILAGGPFSVMYDIQYPAIAKRRLERSTSVRRAADVRSVVVFVCGAGSHVCLPVCPAGGDCRHPGSRQQHFSNRGSHCCFGTHRGRAVLRIVGADAEERLRKSGRFHDVEVLKRFASISDLTQITVLIQIDDGPVRIDPPVPGVPGGLPSPGRCRKRSAADR